MHAATRRGRERRRRGRRRPRQQRAPLDRADREAGEIVVARDGKARASRPSRRRSARSPPGGSPRRCRRRPRRLTTVELAGREVVEKEQWLGALDQQIVDAHRDEVDPDDLVAPVSASRSTLVPTPSVVATRIGSANPAALRSNRPPNPPNVPLAPARAVEARPARSDRPAPRRRRCRPRPRRNDPCWVLLEFLMPGSLVDSCRGRP